MEIPTVELDVLEVLSKSDRDRGEFVSVKKLFVELEGRRTDELQTSFTTALRSLKRKHFVVFKDGDAVRATESGIAALKSM